MASVWRPIELQFPPKKVLNLFVHDWISCERTSGRRRRQNFYFFLLCYERVRNGMEKQWNIYDSKQPFRQSKWALYFAKQWPSLFPRVFHYPFVYGHADFPTLGVKTCCVCNKCEYEAHLKSRVHVWEKANVAFRECSIWCGSRTFLKKLKKKKKKKRALPYQRTASWMTCGSFVWLFNTVFAHTSLKNILQKSGHI